MDGGKGFMDWWIHRTRRRLDLPGFRSIRVFLWEIFQGGLLTAAQNNNLYNNPATSCFLSDIFERPDYVK
jgi:hypothetical protein